VDFGKHGGAPGSEGESKCAPAVTQVCLLAARCPEAQLEAVERQPPA
jgi:hypothetical protein